MNVLQNVLKDLRILDSEISCIIQILFDLQRIYSLDKDKQVYSYIYLFNLWIQDKKNQIDKLSDMIDDELILVHKKEQKN